MTTWEDWSKKREGTSSDPTGLRSRFTSSAKDSLTPWGDRAWAQQDAMKGWEDFYGYTGVYNPGDQINDPRDPSIGTEGQNYGIGFGPGDLRTATNRGYSATSIMNYLSGNDGGGGYSGIIPIEVKNQLRQRMATEEALYHGWKNWSDKFASLDKEKLGEGDPRLPKGVTPEEVDKKIQTETQKVRQNNPYAVVGNTALGIQQKQSPSQVAGQISAGLAGFSRNQKKFQTKTLNV